ncbi:MAG: site-2 protease family protein [Actinomycetota bacterium]|nr:site-2 protease family protein [Actinomycetota bacterium]
MGSWREILYIVVGLFIGMILHEYMHGRIADALGDHTARNAGRLTLNPLAHIDPFGTILIPLALLLVSRGSWIFGYAKPVPVNPFFLRKPRRDMLLVALSGPLTNLVLGFLFGLFGLLVRLVGGASLIGLLDFFYCAAYINVILGIFNLIPIPPLDGSHVVEYFLSPSASEQYQAIAPYGFLLILAFLALFGGIFFRVLTPIFGVIYRLIYGI